MASEIRQEIEDLEFGIHQKEVFAEKMEAKRKGRGKDRIAQKFAKEARKEIKDLKIKLEALKSL